MGRNTGEVKQAEKLHNMRKSQAISTRTLWDSTGPDCPVLPALGLYRGSDVAHSLVPHYCYYQKVLNFPSGKELILPHNHISNCLTSGIMPPLNLFSQLLVWH